MKDKDDEREYRIRPMSAQEEHDQAMENWTFPKGPKAPDIYETAKKKFGMTPKEVEEFLEDLGYD